MSIQQLFHIGPQKSATTWLYECLKEHPQLSAPKKDSIHHFDIFYHKGHDWYLNQFPAHGENLIRFDPTYTYIRSPQAPKRIANDFPDAKLALTLRNPIERAFSHYWHEKKKQTITFKFADCLNNYDLFSSWIETGFYAEHIERYLSYFPKDQLHYIRFEDIVSNPQTVLDHLCVFYEIEKFTPSCIDKVSNPTRPLQTLAGKLETKLHHATEKNIPLLSNLTVPIYKTVRTHNQTNNFERLSDVNQKVVKTLHEIYLPEIERLENLLDVDLSSWKNYG